MDRRKVIVLCLFFMTTLVNAEMTCTAVGCTGVPEFVVTYPNGLVRIYPHGSLALTETTCQAADAGNAISLPISDGQNKLYSMLLAAMSAKRPVFIRTQDTNVSCEVVYIRFDE